MYEGFGIVWILWRGGRGYNGFWLQCVGLYLFIGWEDTFRLGVVDEFGM